MTAESLFADVQTMGESVSLATVYNTLGLFAEMGLVRPVIADPERVFYDSRSYSGFCPKMEKLPRNRLS